MPIHIDLNNTRHLFKKTNLFTLSDRRGHYDAYECEHCKLKGKSRSLGALEVRAERKCTNTAPLKNDGIKKIRIISCNAVGKQFSNLTPESEHVVIPAPKPYKDDNGGVWVMGVGEPVKVLNSEFDRL
jgi:hypothetical protein